MVAESAEREDLDVGLPSVADGVESPGLQISDVIWRKTLEESSIKPHGLGILPTIIYRWCRPPS